MNETQRKHRVQAMMHRFFSLYESANEDFEQVRELLYADGFVWNSPSGDLIGVEAFEESFNNLDRTWKHSHDAEAMTVTLIDDETAQLSFDYIYQNLQGDTLALHAKGHYEITCIDKGERYPRIQKCDLTIVEMIEGGSFNDVLEKNLQLHDEHMAAAQG